MRFSCLSTGITVRAEKNGTGTAPHFTNPMVISAKSPVHAVHNRKPYQQDREMLVHLFLNREQGMARREHWGKCSSASLSDSEGERR